MRTKSTPRGRREPAPWYAKHDMETKCRCTHSVGAHGSVSAICTLCEGCTGFCLPSAPRTGLADDEPEEN